MRIDKKYNDLNSLLKDNEEATKYYNKLPDYIQDAMQQRSGNVNSFESMCHYADNLLAGDH